MVTRCPINRNQTWKFYSIFFFVGLFFSHVLCLPSTSLNRELLKIFAFLWFALFNSHPLLTPCYLTTTKWMKFKKEKKKASWNHITNSGRICISIQCVLYVSVYGSIVGLVYFINAKLISTMLDFIFFFHKYYEHERKIPMVVPIAAVAFFFVEIV